MSYIPLLIDFNSLKLQVSVLFTSTFPHYLQLPACTSQTIAFCTASAVKIRIAFTDFISIALHSLALFSFCILVYIAKN